MNKLFKKYLKWLLVFSPIYIFLILACTIRMNAYVYLPGNLTDVKGEIEVEGYNTKLNGSVSSVYVMDITKPTYFTYALSSVFPFTSSTIVSKEEMSSYDYNLDVAIGSFDSRSSFDSASLAAFYELGDKVDFSFIELTYISRAEKSINSNIKYTEIVGKAIKRVDGIDVDYPVLNDVSTLLSSIPNGDKIHMVLEDEKGRLSDFEITKNVETSKFGITLLKSFKVTESPNVVVKNVYTLGPSGGAMQALYIYLLMCDEDLLKGRKIAGTGTIGYGTINDEVSFSVVGAIGCVGQKLYSAYKDHATIFYCPASNYTECMSYYNKYGFTEDDIKVVKVTTLKDIIDDLRGEA